MGHAEQSKPTGLSTPAGSQLLLAARLGLRRWDDRFRNMAVYGYFEGSERLPGPDESNIFIESLCRRMGVEHSDLERNEQHRNRRRFRAGRVWDFEVWRRTVLQQAA